MKSTGIVRQLDKLGRIVLPKELRKVFQIENEDSLEIYVEEDKIILRKYAPSCIFCSNDDDVIVYKGKHVCPECLAAMKNM